MKQLVSNLAQDLLPFSKIEKNSIFKLEQLVVLHLSQEVLVVLKIETTTFEHTVAQELLPVLKAQELLAVSKIETTRFKPSSGNIRLHLSQRLAVLMVKEEVRHNQEAS